MTTWTLASFASESRKLLALGIPAAGTQFAFMLLGVVDTAMLGHFDETSLAAAGIGNMWHWAFMSFAFGLVFSVESIVAQAFGRKDNEAVALALQRGLVVALIASIPVCLLQALAEPALRALGQPEAVASQAGTYCLVRLPSVPAFLVFMALRVYLQGRNVVWPPLFVALFANGLNALFNWALVFGHLGSPALGITGAALATTLTSLVLPLGLWLYMRTFSLFDGYVRPWDQSSVSWAGLLGVIRLGVPVGVHTALEGWAFALSMGIAGWIGVAELAAHQIVLNVAALAFMIPLGLSIGTATRVGNLLGAGQLEGARWAMRVGLGLSIVWGCCSGGLLLALREKLALVFTSSSEVTTLVALTLPYVAGFQAFDAAQALCSGLLRAMGRPNWGAVINGAAYFLVALPLAYVWGVQHRGGVPAIWGSMTLGLGLVAIGIGVLSLALSRRELDELTIEVR